MAQGQSLQPLYRMYGEDHVELDAYTRAVVLKLPFESQIQNSKAEYVQKANLDPFHEPLAKLGQGLSGFSATIHQLAQLFWL